MEDSVQTRKIKGDLISNKYVNVDGKNISIANDLLKISSLGLLDINDENLKQNEKADEVWATISNNNLERQSNIIIGDYKTRTLLIDSIVNFVVKYDIKGININFYNIDNVQAFNRFILELSPRLREIGVSTNVIITDKLNETDYVGIVDFITEK